MTHVTCRLTAKNWDQLRNPTLCNRVWATFTFFVTDDIFGVLVGKWNGIEKLSSYPHGYIFGGRPNMG